MIVLGLTGSIGMGKSTVAGMLRLMGCAVHDSDQAAHKALDRGGAAFEEVAVTFPDAWDRKKHIINRRILGELVFADPKKRAALEHIVHPAVWQSQKEFLKAQKALGRKVAVLDIPLLFETGAEKRVDYTLCVTAPYAVQRRRVLARPGMTEEKFLAVVNAQMPDSEKRMRADFVVPTGMGYSLTWRTLRAMMRELKK